MKVLILRFSYLGVANRLFSSWLSRARKPLIIAVPPTNTKDSANADLHTTGEYNSGLFNLRDRLDLPAINGTGSNGIKDDASNGHLVLVKRPQEFSTRFPRDSIHLYNLS